MGFEDLGDLSELDEIPPFEEDLTLPGFEDEEGGGVSRTFKIVGALLILAVIAIVVVLLVVLLSGGEELTSGEKTNTAVAQLNATLQGEHDATQTENAVQQTAYAVTQTAIAQILTATHTAEVAGTMTQQARDAKATQDAAATATAEFQASQTAAALTATYEHSLTLTAEWEEKQNTLAGRIIDQNSEPVQGEIVINVYVDDGDGLFNPTASTPSPTEAPDAGASGDSGDEAVAPVKRINYDETVAGTLAEDAVVSWTFSGAADDVAIVEVTANEAAELTLDLALRGPDGALLATGTANEADPNRVGITGQALPEDGAYTIEITSTSGTGSYELTLSLGITAPDATEESGATGYVPRAGGVPLGPVEYPAQAGAGTPTPSPTPGGDSFLTTITTNPDGSFNFGALPPGQYWLVIAYDDLPDDMKSQIDPSIDPVTLLVNVPYGGNVTWNIVGPPTATPDINDINATNTALALTREFLTPATTPPTGDLVTLTPTHEPTVPGTGLFSDIAGGDDSSGASSLAVLAIAAAGLVAVVFVARKLRASSWKETR